MIPEIGLFALTTAAVLAVMLAFVPLWGVHRGHIRLMQSGRSLALGIFALTAFSFACLTAAFVNDDFSVRYVANHSNSLLPLQYKISAVWGGHEGSLLLWAFILVGWAAAVALFSRSLPLEMVARVLSVMGMIMVGFMLFILFTSNPFDRYLPDFPADGSDLNPLLQDIGLILHPPMLYMGYVGFSVAFAFAIAALMSGQLDSAWARWSRPWTIVAWAFLTLGIALGSWWAYYELGWGGWWFWDPVENASFMPWLVGTALVHSLAVTEKRGLFKSWTVLLAIIAFCLSLLGTFLVRSGVLTSVHAFASDPSRGMFVLGLLGFTLIASLTLYAVRAPQVTSRVQHTLLSRESFLLINNVLLIVMWLMVMIGTLYPLVLDFIGSGKLSIGPPYFNSMFVPLTCLLALTMGLGLSARWKSIPLNVWLLNVLSLAGAVILLTLLFAWLAGLADIRAVLGAAACFWVLAITVKDIWQKSANASGRLLGLRRMRRAYWGMVLGHVGFAVCIMGVTMVSVDSVERDFRVNAGDTVTVQDYEFRFITLNQHDGPNYHSDLAQFDVYRAGQKVATMLPEKRRYFSQNSNPMTEAAIDPGLFRDLYVALGEPLEGGAWAVRIQVKSFIRWIWLGALLVAAGGLLAVADRRYRENRQKGSEHTHAA